MADDHRNFSRVVQYQALVRQKHRCASCRLRITKLGEAGRGDHDFGERAEGHHLIPHKDGGPLTVENCVVLCRACHLNAHQGGHWGDISIYDDLAGLPMRKKIASVAALYCNYSG